MGTIRGVIVLSKIIEYLLRVANKGDMNEKERHA